MAGSEWRAPLVARVASSLTVASGTVRQVPFTAFSVMRNEMYFLPAYLDHYRSIGVEQFLIVDDQSEDGTREFLEDQPDCAVLESTFRFGEVLGPVQVRGKRKSPRAGVLMKAAIPSRFLRGRWGVYADADEFLVFPSGLRALEDVAEELSSEGVDSAVSSMVEMYPSSLDAFGSESSPPLSLADLLRLSPFFDGDIRRPWTTGRLFSQFAIDEQQPARLNIFPPWVRRPFVEEGSIIAPKKVNVLRFDGETELVGSHGCSTPSSQRLRLGLLHFKFTPDLLRRVEQATREKSHNRGSIKYFRYAELFRQMQRWGNGSFFGPDTRRFTEAADLEEAGLVFARSTN